VLSAAGGGGAARADALTEGFQAAFLGGAGFALLGIVLAATLIRGRDSRAHVALEQGGERAGEALPKPGS
jgi:hypothetical protein